MLVFCRIHVVAELVGGKPELRLETEVSCHRFGVLRFAVSGHRRVFSGNTPQGGTFTGLPLCFFPRLSFLRLQITGDGIANHPSEAYPFIGSDAVQSGFIRSRDGEGNPLHFFSRHGLARSEGAMAHNHAL